MRTMRSLAKSRLQYSKSRTVLTVIAIMLTTVLLMGLGTSAAGLLDMQRQQAALTSNVHATFRQLTGEQADKLKNHVEVEAVELNELFADVMYERMNGYLNYSETVKSGIYHDTGKLIEGHAAEAADEICGPKAFFERIGAEPVIGNQVTVSFRPNGEGVIETHQFTICGLLSERDISGYDISDSRIVYGAEVSRELVDAFIPPEERRYTANIRVYGEQELSYDEMKAKIGKVAADIGCDYESDVSLNNEYLFTMTDPGTEMAGIVLGIALLIISFSVLMIYSIYYVGVITDVQELGKLKALGASKKQIRRLLLTEGMGVSVLAIPPGLLVGYAIPRLILPVVINHAVQSSVQGRVLEKIHMFSVPVTVTVTAAVLLTVYLSLLKPMRMAAKISPVEAIRYQESGRGGKVRKGNLNVSVFRLSTANLTRNKRRTAVTMTAMGLSCVLFMSFAGVMSSMSAEDLARRNIKTGDFRLELDYGRNDKEYPENNLDSLQQQKLFSDEFVQRITGIDGVRSVERAKAVLVGSEYPSELFENGRRVDLSWIDRAQAKACQKETERGEIDYDAMLAENGAVFTEDPFWEEYGLSIGDTVPLMIYDGKNRISLDIKIAASIAGGDESCFLIPRELYDGLGLTIDSTTDLYISVDKNKYDGVKAAMREIADSNEHFQLYSMDEELVIGGMGVNLIKYPMYVILIMIAVIGFMNLINTMITGIVTRKRELGILQAIGLSERQLTKMLVGEGMVFTAGTLLASVTLGNLFGYLIFLWAKKNHFMSLSAYHYPIWETAALTAALVLGQLMITYFVNRRVRGESLTDRIRI